MPAPTDRRRGAATGPAPAPAPSAWARVRLVKGQSAGGLWDVSSEIPEARIALGKKATWRVDAPGVADTHVELFWDGAALWVADALEGAGNVRVDGQHIDTWYALSGRARVEFGGAALLVETSLVADLSAGVNDAWHVASAPAAPAHALAAGPSKQEMALIATQIAKPQQGSSQQYDIGATKLVSMPEGNRESFDDFDPAMTKVASGGQANASAIAARPMAGPSAVMGGGGMGMGAAPMAMPSPPGYGMMGSPPPQQPAVTNAGVITEPNAPGGAFAGFSPSQAPPVPGKGGKKPALTLPLRTWLMLALVVAVLVVFVLDPEEEVPEPPRRPQQTQTQPAKVPPNPAVPGMPGMPGVPGQPLAVPNPQNPMGVGPGVPTQSGVSPSVHPSLGQPMVPPYPQPGQPMVPPIPQPGQPMVPPIPQPGQPFDPGQQAMVPPQPGQPVPGQPMPGQPGGVDPMQVPIPTGPSPRLAADLYIAGRWSEALPLYEALAAQNPTNTAYAEIARILRRRLSQQCRDGIGPGGVPCTPTQ